MSYMCVSFDENTQKRWTSMNLYSSIIHTCTYIYIYIYAFVIPQFHWPWPELFVLFGNPSLQQFAGRREWPRASARRTRCASTKSSFESWRANNTNRHGVQIYGPTARPPDPRIIDL